MKKRIVGRLGIGVLVTLVVSFLFYAISVVIFDKNIIIKFLELIGISTIPEVIKLVANSFSTDDILFSSLSLVFLVLSFVSLLAGKTESIYWVDSIHYHLIEPQFFSIIDMAAYLFGALFCCFVAYLFPNDSLEVLSVASFVVIVVLLSYMSFKLLVSFFGTDSTKRKLRKDYENALLFRKWVYSCVKSQEKFVPKELYMYSEQFGYHDEITDCYEKIKNFPEQFEGKEEKKNIDLYRKKYGYDIYSFAKMRDGLFENLQECIARNDIPNIVEQISFLAEYHEYNLVYFSLDNLAELCPAAIPKALDKLVPIISQCHSDSVDYIYNQLFKYLENITKTKCYMYICNPTYYNSIETIIKSSRDDMFSLLIEHMDKLVFSSSNISVRQQEDLCLKITNASISRVEKKIIDSYINDDDNSEKLCISLRNYIVNKFVASVDANRADLAASIIYHYVCFLERIAFEEKISGYPFDKFTSQKHLFRENDGNIYKNEFLNTLKLDKKISNILLVLGYAISSEITQIINDRFTYYDVLHSDKGLENINYVIALCTRILNLLHKKWIDQDHELLLINETSLYIKNSVLISRDYNYNYEDYEDEIVLSSLKDKVVAELFGKVWEEMYHLESEIVNIIKKFYEQEGPVFDSEQGEDALKNVVAKLYYNCTWEECVASAIDRRQQ